MQVVVQSTKLSVRLAKEALFILIHHGLVRYRVTGDEDAVVRPVVYRIDIDRVILRLAYPSFATIAEKYFSVKVLILPVPLTL